MFKYQSHMYNWWLYPKSSKRQKAGFTSRNYPCRWGCLECRKISTADRCLWCERGFLRCRWNPLPEVSDVERHLKSYVRKLAVGPPCRRHLRLLFTVKRCEDQYEQCIILLPIDSTGFPKNKVLDKRVRAWRSGVLIRSFQAVCSPSNGPEGFLWRTFMQPL